jgi:uncharacterized membrane protein
MTDQCDVNASFRSRPALNVLNGRFRLKKTKFELLHKRANNRQTYFEFALLLFTTLRFMKPKQNKTKQNKTKQNKTKQTKKKKKKKTKFVEKRTKFQFITLLQTGKRTAIVLNGAQINRSVNILTLSSETVTNACMMTLILSAQLALNEQRKW